MSNTFYWHDYETWGINPRLDRAAQFAGVRTDLDFNIMGKPLMIYARPANDFLPHPEACLITGITPQQALKKGIPEADFFAQINQEMAQPGTCALGYNSIRFDDEFTRFGLYRNFFDPYAREWQNGNSRWDIIDLVRLTRALRPDGINWPLKENGVTSFKLEALTAANNIEHVGAHDALVDVRATIALAKLIKTQQPKLFDFVFNNRNKHKLAQQLSVANKQPVLHVSAKIAAKSGCIASVVPVANHPSNKNSVIVFDLRADPQVLLDLTAAEIQARLFVATADLAEGQTRIPLKEIKTNHAPVIVPMGTITPQAREEWDLDAAREAKHLKIIQQATGLQEKMDAVFSGQEFPEVTDPDQGLYAGFFSTGDRRLSEQIRQMDAQSLATLQPKFKDKKLVEMLFRYRARNWLDTLSADEQQRWEQFRLQRLQDESVGISLDGYRKKLSHLAIDPNLSDAQKIVVNELLDWPELIGL